MTVSITTPSLPTFSITAFCVMNSTLWHFYNDTQHNDTQYNNTEQKEIQYNNTKHNALNMMAILHNDTQHDGILHNDTHELLAYPQTVLLT